MAAPDFVPTEPTQKLRVYSSPPRRQDAWTGDRPGDYVGPPPKGPALGTTGPDAGYAYKLVRQFDDRLHLGDVSRDDAVSGCVALAMRRAALMGRAPVVHDLTVAFTVYGFFDPKPDPALAAARARAFAEIESHHHYFERRQVVDAVAEEALRQPHGTIAERYKSDWRQQFVDNSALTGGGHGHGGGDHGNP